MSLTAIKCKFSPGAIHITPAAVHAIGDTDYAVAALTQHLKGNWGIVDSEDWDSNDLALKHGGRLLSVYPMPNSEQSFWIISEADRSSTTILLPSDY